MNPDECKQFLLAGIEKINPIFNPLGFVFEISGVGSSSVGPFASGFYSKDDKEVWLIYRARAGLGAIIYQYHQLGIIHDDLMNYLKKSDVSKLKYSNRKFASFSKGGGDPFEAFGYDIQNFTLEFLNSNATVFEGVLQQISLAKNADAIHKRHSRTLRRSVSLGIFYGTLLGAVIGGLSGSLLLGILVGVGIGLMIIFLGLRNEKSN